MKKLALVSLLLTGCANQAAIKQNAYVVGRSSNIVVEGLYGGWDRRANDRISECVEKLPPETHTKSEYDACVGPFNEKVQARVLVLVQGVQAAQLILFLALSQNLSDDEVKQALRDVVASVNLLRTFIEANR